MSLYLPPHLLLPPLASIIRPIHHLMENLRVPLLLVPLVLLVLVRRALRTPHKLNIFSQNAHLDMKIKIELRTKIRDEYISSVCSTLTAVKVKSSSYNSYFLYFHWVCGDICYLNSELLAQGNPRQFEISKENELFWYLQLIYFYNVKHHSFINLPKVNFVYNN